MGCAAALPRDPKFPMASNTNPISEVDFDFASAPIASLEDTAHLLRFYGFGPGSGAMVSWIPKAND